jgi:hypothetical protein
LPALRSALRLAARLAPDANASAVNGQWCGRRRPGRR